VTAGVLTVRPAAGPGEIAAALELRRAVFVEEQGVTLAEDLDGRDGEAVHLVAIDHDGGVIGTCRLLAAGEKIKLGRMAVAPVARRRGIAAALLDAADAQAVALGGRRIVLAAQTYAMTLYERAGYTPYGDVFPDAGIEHRWMEKRVA